MWQEEDGAISEGWTMVLDWKRLERRLPGSPSRVLKIILASRKEGSMGGRRRNEESRGRWQWCRCMVWHWPRGLERAGGVPVWMGRWRRKMGSWMQLGLLA